LAGSEVVTAGGLSLPVCFRVTSYDYGYVSGEVKTDILLSNRLEREYGDQDNGNSSSKLTLGFLVCMEGIYGPV